MTNERDGLDFEDGLRCPQAIGEKGTKGPAGIPKQDSKKATPPPFDIGAALCEIASIEDELARLDTSALTKRREELKAKIKEEMISTKLERAQDEISGYTAEIQVRTTEEWHLDAFKKSVGPKAVSRYVKTQEFLDSEAIKDSIKSGALSRAKLEVEGAVTKTLSSLALYIRPPEKKN